MGRSRCSGEQGIQFGISGGDAHSQRPKELGIVPVWRQEFEHHL